MVACFLNLKISLKLQEKKNSAALRVFPFRRQELHSLGQSCSSQHLSAGQKLFYREYCEVPFTKVEDQAMITPQGHKKAPLYSTGVEMVEVDGKNY